MCDRCVAIEVENKRLRLLLKEADDVVRLAYLEMAKIESDGYGVSRARFNRPRFDQVAQALKVAVREFL